MTFDEIVSDIRDRLNLTSDASLTRIEDGVNDLYKEVTSSIGLIVSRRVVDDFELDPGDAELEDQHPELEITGMEKVFSIRQVDGTRLTLLSEVTYDELTNVSVKNGTPRKWAVVRMAQGSVTVAFESLPAATVTLRVEGLDRLDTLDDDDVPAFPESFHDILVQGVIADELLKMEKPQLAAIADAKYEKRLSDLRMFIAKSGYLDIHQGKVAPYYRWPWTQKR